jgi:hypothetical protein
LGSIAHAWLRSGLRVFDLRREVVTVMPGSTDRAREGLMARRLR